MYWDVVGRSARPWFKLGTDECRYSLKLPGSQNYAPGVSALMPDPSNYGPDPVQIISGSQGLCCGSPNGGQAGAGLGGLGKFGVDLSQQDPNGVWLVTMAARPENTFSGVPPGGDYTGMFVAIEMFDGAFAGMSAWVGDVSQVGTSPTVGQLEGNLATPNNSYATCCGGILLDIRTDTIDVLQVTPPWPYGNLGETWAYDIYEIRVKSPGVLGDVNGDGDELVNSVDFEKISDNFGLKPATREQGDLTRNQEVDLLDFRQSTRHAESLTTGIATAAHEPATTLLALLGGLLVGAGRLRDSRG